MVILHSKPYTLRGGPLRKLGQRLGEYIASTPLILLVKPGGGIRPIVVGTVWRRGSEAILHSVNRLIEACGDVGGGFQERLQLDCTIVLWGAHIMVMPRSASGLSLHAWYFDDGTSFGDIVVVRKVLKLIMEDGPVCGLHLNVDKTEVFWPKEDPQSRLVGYTLLCTHALPVSLSLPNVLLTWLFSIGLQTKLLWHIGIVSPGPIFDDALSVFNTSMEIDLLSNPTSSRVFAGDIYRGYVVSCIGIIGIKHCHNVVCDTFVDVCYRSGISAGKEVDIGLDGGRDKPLHLADILLYSWDGKLDVCVDLTGTSPLTQTGMVDFVLGRAVIDVAQHKRDKYMAKCASIGYGFLPFYFSSLWELEADVVTLLKWI
ncbi:hypothetical protein Tco_0381486 [Tanacetum coccineum]